MSAKKPAHTRVKTLKKTHRRSGFTKVFPVIVAVLVLIVIGAGVATFKDSLSAWWRTNITIQLKRRTPQPTPTPRPIPHGKISFTVGGNNIQGPRFSAGFLDPYDPAQKTEQTIQVDITSSAPVVSAWGIMMSDHKTQSFPFTLTSGTTTQGTWQGKWMVNDTYLYTYTLEIHAVGANGSNMTGITLR
jgi:hypothetical protein